ncbi:MAG: hypothetical protein IKL27_04350 [Oscillospiraceae bacterium]|nr:hypothetical protein [Oscillospiraceae bacterium]
MESGTVRLRNTKSFPFNDSAQLVALEKEQSGRDYAVLTEVVGSEGEVGDIVVSGKAVNGFSLEFTGSAREAEIRWRIVGECE